MEHTQERAMKILIQDHLQVEMVAVLLVLHLFTFKEVDILILFQQEEIKVEAEYQLLDGILKLWIPRRNYTMDSLDKEAFI